MKQHLYFGNKTNLDKFFTKLKPGMLVKMFIQKEWRQDFLLEKHFFGMNLTAKITQEGNLLKSYELILLSKHGFVKFVWMIRLSDSKQVRWIMKLPYHYPKT